MEKEIHHNFVSLSYKKVFGRFTFISLFVLLCICGFIYFFLYPTNETLSSIFSRYVPEIFKERSSAWAVYSAGFMVFLSVVVFAVNQMAYIFFISDKINLFHHMDGFPLEPQTLFNKTDIPKEWFLENFHDTVISKKDFKRVVRAFNEALS